MKAPKFVVSLLITLIPFVSLFSLADPVIASPGDLDPSFGNKGKVIMSFSPAMDWIEDIAIQSDGKIVAVGRIGFEASVTSAFGVARFNQNGTLDTSFGTGGSVTTQFSAQFSWAESVAIQPDGKIIACGTAGADGRDWFALARYLPDGTLDTSFSGDGKLETGIGEASAAYTMALQPDGKIVAAGTSKHYIAVVRYLSDGSLDKQFGHLGKLTTTIGAASEQAFAMKIQPDGKIVIAGLARIGQSDASIIVRYTTNGRLDKTFDTDGYQLTSFGLTSSYLISLAIQSDNKILAAGLASSGTGTGVIALARYNSNGSLDTTFNGDGRVTTYTGDFENYAYAVKVQPDGKIIAAGLTRRNSPGRPSDFLVVRYNADGALDNVFGTGGVVKVPMSDYYDEIRGLAIQSDGRIIAAGGVFRQQEMPIPEISDFGLVRLMGD